MHELYDELSDEYQLDSDEESYHEYQQSLRYKLDVYLHEIDPWLIPLQRAFIIGVSLHYFLA